MDEQQETNWVPEVIRAGSDGRVRVTGTIKVRPNKVAYVADLWNDIAEATDELDGIVMQRMWRLIGDEGPTNTLMMYQEFTSPNAVKDYFTSPKTRLARSKYQEAKKEGIIESVAYQYMDKVVERDALGGR